MATIVKRNAASKKYQNQSTTAANPTSGNKGVVTATTGSGASPSGWYGTDHDTRTAAAGLTNPTPSASDIQGMPSAAISFNGPSAAVTSGVTVGQAPGSTGNQTSGFQRRTAPTYTAFTYDDFEREDAPEYTPFQYEKWTAPEFNTSDLTNEYQKKMQDTENAKPADFNSRYEGAIQTILDGILKNGNKPFDINTDANYQTLYNQYAQRYQAQADRAMRDTMGAMQAGTGGYGSTAATAAAGQAYDRTMEGLNDNNIALMQMAYQMYGDRQADRLNQLGAVTGLDDTDYARYRDTVGDWQNDRNYFADQYQRMYGNDWTKYAYDTDLDWNNYQFRTNLDWQNHQAEQQRLWDAYTFGTQMDWNKYQFQTGLDAENHQAAQQRLWDDYTFGTNMDWNEYTDAANREYQAERDSKSDYDAAFNRALSLAQSGMSIPAAYGNQLEPETLEQLNALAAQVQAQKALAASGGSGGGRSRSGEGPGTTSVGGEQMTLDQFNQDVAEILIDNPNLSASKVASDLRKLYQDNGIGIVSGKYTEGNKASIGALRQAEYAVDTTEESENRRKKVSKTTKKKK